ncbi:hypothetical protein M0R45_001315 [Rubus argutus]|uniref:DEP domain-containing protein n=1 Tax=Rubus argutus TaxID=59490 RepID=A0AAW1VLY1_RUBAR
MEKEASTEEKTTSSLSAENSGGPKLDNNHVEDELVDKMDMSGDLNCKDQGDKLDNDPIHRDVCGKINDSRDFDYNAQERELDSNKGQKNLADKVESNAEEENLDNDGKHLESKAQEEIADKFFGEKEPEPVFDGTEFPGMEAYRSMSIHSSDPDSETPGVVEKAVALTNLVKVKGVVAVSTFLRRLSGSRNEDVDGRDKAADAIDEPVQAIAMKGRIILYTRLGCQDCKDARLFLYWKKLRYTEINIDVYPSRKQELEKYSGSSAVPKVFFNEVLIGGLSELKGLDVSGKLDEKIDYLVNEAPSFEAPLPPLSGEDDVSNSGAIDELALVVRKMKEFVVVKDQFYKMRRFTKSFSGSEAVDFLSEDQYLEREEAIEFGRKLASKLFFQHVLEENLFEDGNHLYRFLDDDPIVSQCHNIPKGIIDVKPKPIIDIASRLRFLSCAILEAYVSEDGKHIDYRSIHGSEEFARYLRTVEELHRVELQDMRREERRRDLLYKSLQYDGHPCNTAIQNGILRGNQRPPYNLMKPFSPKDKRAMVALPYAEPLIHLRGTWFLNRNGGLIIDFDTKVASANKILKWFSIDFGKNEMEPKVMYQPYDWGLNC